MSKTAAIKRGRPVDPAKREAILETARELFFEHGYGVGLETIAARAGVSRQTIYNLFESKDDLFAAIVQESSGQITAALAELTPESTPREVLTALGVSFLTNVGLPELIAGTREQYVSMALALARDLDRLEAIRSSLRERMRGSAITNGPRFVRHLENAYRDMWRVWCARQSDDE